MRRYRQEPGSGLAWETFGEASFVYHPASGQTHFLNELAAWILRHVDATPASAADVSRALVSNYAAESSAALETAVEQTLESLCGLGLLDQADGA